MALPTVEKTWETSLNNRFGNGNADTDHREALYQIASKLTGFTNNPWTLVGSSDASTYGYPGPGWSDYTDIVTSYSGNRSWVVLERPNSGGQVLFYVWNSYNSSTYYYTSINITWSPGGNFTGGDLTSKPTATDEITMSSNSYTTEWYHGETATGRPCSMHFRHSTDGKHTYLFLCSNGRCNNILIWTTPEDYPSAWTTPHLMAMDDDTGENAENATYSTYYSNQNFHGRDNADALISASLVVPAYDGSLITSTMSLPGTFDTTNSYLMAPVYVGTNGAAGYGILGKLPDFWAGSTARSTSDTYPDDNTRTFAQFGDFIVPWDTTVPTSW